MNTKELAQLLNGSQRRSETDRITREQWHKIKENRLVIAYGQSDDLLEFEGAISDEVGAYEGQIVYLDKDGLIVNDCSCDDDCPNWNTGKFDYFVEAEWYPNNDYTWIINSNIPHETFDILSDDDPEDKFCKGIVFCLNDLSKEDKTVKSKHEQALEIAVDFIQQCIDEGTVGEYAQDILKDIQETIK